MNAVAERILITGASGNVGLETLRELMKPSRKGGFEVVAGVRNPDKVKKSIDVQPDAFRHLDFADVSTFHPALLDVDRVLLIRPSQLADVDTYFKPFIDTMKRVGVHQVVFLSLQGVETNSVTPHFKIEKLIVEGGLPFTFLRPSFFMQNLSTTHRDEIRLRNEIFVPAGKGRTSFVDVRDVGAIAALALTDQTGSYLNRSYELTGSEALTYNQVAKILTGVLGRTILYRDPSILHFVWQKWHHEHLPLGFTLVMVALYTVAKLGKADALTNETERLLHRPPLTFRQFAGDYRAVWIPEP